MGRLDRGEARGSGLLWAWDGMFWVWGDAVDVPFGVHRCDVCRWGMFFVRVNQVLVRLWARCGSKSDRMVGVLRGGLVRGCWVRDWRPAVAALCSEATVVC